MNKTPLIEQLENLYEPVGNQWVTQNSLVLNIARQSGIAIGGSIAMAITRKKVVKEPGDLDFFTSDMKKAEDFVKRITDWLNNRPNTYYNIRINNETTHCLEGVIRHYRLVVPFWLPICVMVLEKPIRQFWWNKQPVQFFDDVVQAAKQTTAIDGKERAYYMPKIPNPLEEEFENHDLTTSAFNGKKDRPNLSLLIDECSNYLKFENPIS